MHDGMRGKPILQVQPMAQQMELSPSNATLPGDTALPDDLASLRFATGPRRVVVLGASNVANSLASVVGTARAALGGPLDFLAAMGHGRSYGLTSHVFGRSLEGIVDCGLWTSLYGREPLPTVSVVTDIGNDLLYGQPVERIADWVETCVARLEGLSQLVVLAALPVENLRHMTAFKYTLLRTVLFPGCRVPWNTMLGRVMMLNQRIHKLAREYDAVLIALPPEQARPLLPARSNPGTGHWTAPRPQDVASRIGGSPRRVRRSRS